MLKEIKEQEFLDIINIDDNILLEYNNLILSLNNLADLLLEKIEDDDKYNQCLRFLKARIKEEL